MFETLLSSHFAFKTGYNDHFANKTIHSRHSRAHALTFAQFYDLLDPENGSNCCDQPKKSKNSRKNIFLQNRFKMHRKRLKCKIRQFWTKNILVTRLSFFRQNPDFDDGKCIFETHSLSHYCFNARSDYCYAYYSMLSTTPMSHVSILTLLFVSWASKLGQKLRNWQCRRKRLHVWDVAEFSFCFQY